MSAILRFMNRRQCSPHSYDTNKHEEFIVLPLINTIKYIGKEYCYGIPNGYFEERVSSILDGMVEKQDFVFIVDTGTTLCVFDFEKEALDFLDLLEKELEDFYENYTEYVTVLH